MASSDRYTRVKAHHRRGHKRKNPDGSLSRVPPTDVRAHERRVPWPGWEREHVATHRRPYEDRTVPYHERKVYARGERLQDQPIARPRKELTGSSMLYKAGYDVDAPASERKAAIDRAMGTNPPEWRRREIYRELLELRKYRSDTEEAREFHDEAEESDTAEMERLDEYWRIQDDQEYIMDEYGVTPGMETGADYTPYVEESVVKHQ